MPHMNEVIDLLGTARNYLINMDALMTMEIEGYCDKALWDLTEKIREVLNEYEALKVGHLARS